MEPKAGLPAAFESEVLAKAADNLSSRQIAEWLETAHSCKVSHSTIARFLAKRRTERADVAKSVVREQLGKTLNADIDRLEEIRADLAARAARTLGRDDISTFARLTELEIRVIDRKLHYSGAGEPDATPQAPNIGGVIFLPPESDD